MVSTLKMVFSFPFPSARMLSKTSSPVHQHLKWKKPSNNTISLHVPRMDHSPAPQWIILLQATSFSRSGELTEAWIIPRVVHTQPPSPWRRGEARRGGELSRSMLGPAFDANWLHGFPAPREPVGRACCANKFWYDSTLPRMQEPAQPVKWEAD